MKINKKELQKALEIVKPGLANTELIEQSTSFAFMNGKVITYNDSISISHPVDQLDLHGAVRAEELYELLNRIDQEEIAMKIMDNQIGIKAGNAKARLKLKQEIVLPIQEAGEITEEEWAEAPELPESFVYDLDFIKDSASGDMSRRVLTCVNVEETHMEASDGFQIMKVYLDLDNPFPFPGTLIPAEVIPDIKKIEPYKIQQTNGWLHFQNRDGTVLSCRTLMDTYPDTGDHFDVDGQKLVFPGKMPEILDRAMVFTKGDDLLDDEMQVLIKNNKLKVYGSNDYGDFEEIAKVKYEGKKASFWITPYLLKNILKRSNDCELGEEKIKFKGEGWDYIAVLRGE